MKRSLLYIGLIVIIYGCTQKAIPDSDNKLKRSNIKDIDVIEEVFNCYISGKESTDSPSNKEAIEKALKNLGSKLYDEELALIINVWMYYDPTDFPTRNLVEEILSRNGERSVRAIEYRIDHKMEWESVESAPYSELEKLLERINRNTAANTM